MWQIAKVSVLGRTMTTISPDWIIPSAIPFEHLKAKDLEECLFWLLDAMGAQNIEWRIGGTGGGAPDGGRDLEAHTYSSKSFAMASTIHQSSRL